MLRRFIESGKVWVLAVVALLLLNVGVCAVTVIAATSDPVAAAVEPDYYQRAVDWDRSRAQWPPPSKPGWSLQTRDLGHGAIEVLVTDAATGAPVPDLRGRIEGAHAGESLITLDSELQPGTGGRLIWKPDGLTPGMWTLKIWLEGGGRRAHDSQRIMIGG